MVYSLTVVAWPAVSRERRPYPEALQGRLAATRKNALMLSLFASKKSGLQLNDINYIIIRLKKN